MQLCPRADQLNQPLRESLPSYFQASWVCNSPCKKIYINKQGKCLSVP